MIHWFSVVIWPHVWEHMGPNNNTESMNHVLKQATQWRLQQMPQPIETLSSVANFILAESYRRYGVHPHVWVGKSSAERRTTLDKFIGGRRPSTKGMVCSTDGNPLIATTPSAGKKPYQAQRRSAARTRPKKIIHWHFISFRWLYKCMWFYC